MLDRTRPHIAFRPDVLERQAGQTEFTRPIWDYLDITASEDRIRKGRRALREHRALFNALEARFGVESEVVAAIWGIETGYGTIRGDVPVLSALATLAWRGRRAAYFETEFIAALRLVQTGKMRLEEMNGSWAGALGHGQFMPSSILEFAVDFDGDRRLGLCDDDPTDGLASIANYLAKHAWKPGQPWGLEVRLPEGFDLGLTGRDHVAPASVWAKTGVTAADGTALPDYGHGSILLPAGARGPALLVLQNFHVLTSYNRADAYAIAVGHLADRLAGGKPFRQPWPTDEPVLNRAEILELQQRLTRAGFDTFGADGLIGRRTRRALRGWQAARGLPADSHPSAGALAALRAEQAGERFEP
ncbi:MAG: lytic murein transglycosylase [Alphaproteobacteria bacterium]|nr:MAG: lytic murein transglycosylase [Alphaproteobacteria bacterium]